MDTPGIRISDDDVEQQAIGLAKQVIDEADVLVYMSDLQNGFEAANLTNRKPDILTLNKVDALTDDDAAQLPKQLPKTSTALDTPIYRMRAGRAS